MRATRPRSSALYQDNEYVRNDTCSIFLSTKPLASWQYTEAKQQWTRTGRAAFIKWRLDEQYPNAEVVVLVCDNLSTHNIAEIEPSALGNQCLSKRRIDSVDKLNEEHASWNMERNAGHKSANWQFKTADVRIKLKHLYPILNF